jgi:hypothetical protein
LFGFLSYLKCCFYIPFNFYDRRWLVLKIHADTT